MEVSSETKRKVKDFVLSEFGEDRIRNVDLRLGFDSLGNDSFILSFNVNSSETFEDKGSQVFNLIRNIIDIGGSEFRGLTPVIDLHTERENK